MRPGGVMLTKALFFGSPFSVHQYIYLLAIDKTQRCAFTERRNKTNLGKFSQSNDLKKLRNVIQDFPVLLTFICKAYKDVLLLNKGSCHTSP